MIKFWPIVALAISTSPITSYAATWIEIGGNDDVTTYIDKDSVRRSGSRVKTWLKWEWVKPKEYKGTHPAKMYQSEKQLQISDCSANTLAIAQGILYADLQGHSVVESYSVPENSLNFLEAVPETIGETIVRYSCKLNSQKKNNRDAKNQ